MAQMREDYIHYSIRNYLRAQGWLLIAGQYPDGSDDELSALNITDPVVARDNSPDPRRHSQNKIVPDLVCSKNNVILIIEMKPSYSEMDEKKLVYLLTERYEDMVASLQDFLSAKEIVLERSIEEYTFVPCLAFSASSRFNKRQDFCYFRVHDLHTPEFEGNASISI
ncbi:MAG: hypothetical protein OXI59_15390 [Gemmatimonadota bacterium]|nr:hypothetical protein [Gemmatimonadota bacterium]MYD64157.1 hypothetical protein [Gemmatimonadota bacterium]